MGEEVEIGFNVNYLLDALAGVVEPVEIRYLWRPQLTDADDDMVLECAVNGNAQRLVTFNANHFREVARRFGIRVRSPGQVLQESKS